MRPSPYYERVVDVMEELVKFTLMVRGRSDYLVDRYSERQGADEARAKTISIDESLAPPTTPRLQRPGCAAGCPAVGRRARPGPEEGASAGRVTLETGRRWLRERKSQYG